MTAIQNPVDLAEARRLADALLEDAFEAEAYPFKQSAAALNALADWAEALRSERDMALNDLVKFMDIRNDRINELKAKLAAYEVGPDGLPPLPQAHYFRQLYAMQPNGSTRICNEDLFSVRQMHDHYLLGYRHGNAATKKEQS